MLFVQNERREGKEEIASGKERERIYNEREKSQYCPTGAFFSEGDFLIYISSRYSFAKIRVAKTEDALFLVASKRRKWQVNIVLLSSKVTQHMAQKPEE